MQIAPQFHWIGYSKRTTKVKVFSKTISVYIADSPNLHELNTQVADYATVLHVRPRSTGNDKEQFMVQT